MVLAREIEPYCRSVCQGAIPGGRLHRLACQRQLDDLARQGRPDFPYVWDEAAADTILGYAQVLTIAEGREEKPLELEPWEAFVLASLWGWRQRDTGLRRFRLSYLEVARQNGKSLLNGVMASHEGNFGGYRYGQVYLAATKKDQAKIVFKEVAKFIGADPELAELFDVKDYVSEIRCLLTEGVIKALSRETGSIDGFRPLFGSLDEYHAHPTDEMFKQLENGQADLDECLLSIITTAGKNPNCPCYEQRRVYKLLLEGGYQNETIFVDIHCLDEEDDIWDPANWIKANPHVCRTPEGVARMQAQGEAARLQGGSALRDFRVKRLNQWLTGGENPFVEAEDFMACGTALTLEDFRGCRAYAGLDLSSGGDLTTLHLEIPYTADGRLKYYMWSHSYMPRGRMLEHMEGDLAPYDQWEEQGLITVTGGMGDYKNDYGFIVSELAEAVANYQLELAGIGYDPHNADGFLARLEQLGADLYDVTQSARNLNDATQDLQLLVKNRDLSYDQKNALLVWSVCNAATVSNSFGEIKVDKEGGKRTRRIDPVDAMVDAHWLALKNREPQTVDYDAALENWLAAMG